MRSVGHLYTTELTRRFPFRATALALAIAGLSTVGPAQAAPADDATSVLSRLQTGPYSAEVTSVFGISVTGVEGFLAALLSGADRTTFLAEVESPQRTSLTVTAGELKGVRVVYYDGSVFAARGAGPLVKATGDLRKYLTDNLPPTADETAVSAAVELPPYQPQSAAYRRLDVQIDRTKLQGVIRQTFKRQGLGSLPANVIRIDRAQADMFLRLDGPLALSKTRAKVSFSLAAFARALGTPASDELKGIRMVISVAQDVQITSPPGAAVVVAPPLAARTSNKLATIGLPDPPPPRPAGPFGDEAGIALARRVNRSYQNVRAIRIAGGSEPLDETIVFLRNGREEALVDTSTDEEGTSVFYVTQKATFARPPGRECWIEFPEPTSPINTPVITMNGTEFFPPRPSGAEVRLRVNEGPTGTPGTYTIDRVTGRILTSGSGDDVQTWTVLTSIPPLPVTRPLCPERPSGGG
jgi:hypothetical protein